MSRKLLAMGNVLMGDDGIGIHLATALQEELSAMGIEVIYGETDIGYCITNIQEDDYIIIVDAADFGATTGDINKVPLEEISSSKNVITGHSISFLELIKLYLPKIKGTVLEVQIAEINFQYGLSQNLQNRFSRCAEDVLNYIRQITLLKE